MAKFVCNFISYTLGRTVDITVVLPTPTIPQSLGMGEEPTFTVKDKYPVLYLLHGTGNNHATWIGYTKAELYAEEHEIALVCMSAENRDYVDNGDGDFMNFLEEELPDFVCGLFPISERREDTYIAGLSMGGFGTLVHALRHPEHYGAFGAFSAGIGDVVCPKDIEHDFDPMQYKTIRPFPRGYRKDINPYYLAKDLYDSGKPFPKAYLCCGEKDGYLNANKEFADLLASYGADVTWHSMAEYGHEWRFWESELERFLKWLPRSDPYGKKGTRRI